MMEMVIFLENSANMHLAGDLPGIWDFTFKKQNSVGDFSVCCLFQ